MDPLSLSHDKMDCELEDTPPGPFLGRLPKHDFKDSQASQHICVLQYIARALNRLAAGSDALGIPQCQEAPRSCPLKDAKG